MSNLCKQEAVSFSHQSQCRDAYILFFLNSVYIYNKLKKKKQNSSIASLMILVALRYQKGKKYIYKLKGCFPNL